MRKTNIKFFTLSVIVVLVAMLMAVSVTAQDVAREDTVIFDIDAASVGSPFNYNFFIPGTHRNQGMHQAVWEPLFILNYETGEIQPWLGESMVPNETLDVWTLTLFDGIKWQDGEDFNADDVLWTINFLKDNPGYNESGNIGPWVESVEKIDDLTVQFNLTRPNPRFQLDVFSVRIWGSVLIMPEHVFSQVEDMDTFTFYDPAQGWPFGTGPYTLTSNTETEWIYDRYDDYWGVDVHGLPEPLRLEFIITGAEESKALLMADSQLDSAMDMSLGALEAVLAQNPNVIAWFDDLPFAWPDPCPRQISVNHTIEPWDDANMRQALSLIIDRNQVVDIAYEGTTIPSRTFFVDYGGLADILDNVPQISPEPDVAAAQALIEGAGYEMNANGFYERDGQVLSLNIQASEDFIEKRRITNVVVEQFREAGIDATASVVAGPTWGTNKSLGDFEGIADWDFCASVNEPWASFNQFNVRWLAPIGEETDSRNRNIMRWSGERAEAYSAIVDEIGELPLGDPRVVELSIEAYSILLEEMPAIPITQAKKIVPFDTTYWVGWPTAEDNYNHPATWWNSTHQIIHNLRRAN
jgi:peptide/nickel transport system substrate-binding protein